MKVTSETHMEQLNRLTDELQRVRTRAGSRSSRSSSDAWVDVRSSTGVAEAGADTADTPTGSDAVGGPGDDDAADPDSASAFSVPDVPRRF